MNRFLDFLDESAGGLIRVAYLVWGIVAVAAYFGDGTAIPLAITSTLAALAPWVLAFAIETHSYLTARRVRAAWQALQTTPADSAPRHSLRVNLGILAGLVAFSMFNQLQYLAATWTPPHTALSLPGPLAYVVRAVIVPAAFMAAAFLAPIGTSLAAQIQAEAHRMAAATFKVSRRQWKARLKQMERNGEDVTAALVQLVDDPAERHVVEVIHAAIHPTPFERVLEDAHDTRPSGDNSPTPLALVPPRQRAASSRSNPTQDAVEKKARKVWTPGMTVSQLERAAGISRNAASKWRRVLSAEQAERIETEVRA